MVWGIDAYLPGKSGGQKGEIIYNIPRLEKELADAKEFLEKAKLTSDEKLISMAEKQLFNKNTQYLAATGAENKNQQN